MPQPSSDSSRLDAVLNTVLDGLITIDSQGVIQSFNPAATRIFGYQPDEVIGHNVKMLMPDPYHSEHDGYLDNYLTTGDRKIIGIGREVAAKRKDGSVFPMELGVNEMDIDGERMFVGTIRDITDRKEAETQLASEAARLDAVLNTVLDGLITIDRSGEIQGFNPAATRIFGYEPDEVIGQNVRMLMPEPYHGEHDGYLENYLTTGDEKIIGIGREVSAKRKDGSVFPMELGVNEMEIDGERMFVGTIRDITQRKEAEERLATEVGRMDAVLKTVLDGLITIDSRGIIQSFNPAAMRIFGYEPDEVIGRNVKMLMPEPYHGEHDGYLENYLTTGDEKIIGIGREVSAKRKDGSIFPMELGVNEMDIDGERMFVGTIRDITERKEAEEEILRSNTELERFAYVASHDLKEPLRMVTSFTRLLDEHYGDTLDETAKQYLDFAHSGGQRMQLLVNDLLEYARIGTDSGNAEEIEVCTIISLVEENLKVHLEACGARMVYQPADFPTVYANPVRLSRLLQNLVGNGIKFRKSGVAPEIGIAARESDGIWTISVRDNGIGMKPEYCERIFEPFKRLHAKDEYGGIGMGLAICRRIVEGFDGRIWAETQPGHGSVFHFTIPSQIGRSVTEKSEAT